MASHRSEHALEAITTAVFVVVLTGLPLLYTTQVLHPFSSPKLIALAGAALLGSAGSLVAACGHRPFERTGYILAGTQVVLAILALAASTVPSVSVWGRHNQETGAIAMLLTLLLLGFTINSSRPPHHVTWFRWIPLWAPVILATFTILQVSGLRGLGILDYDAGHRPYLTLGNPLHLGAVLASSAVYAASMSHKLHPPRRWVAYAIAALCFAGVLLTSSASALLGCVVGMVYIFILWRPWRNRTYFLVGGLLLLGCVVLYLAGRSGLTAGPLHVLATRGGLRPTTYQIAIETVMRNPLLGVGPANFQSAVLDHLTPYLVRTAYSQELATDAHSLPLELASTYGVLFAVLFLASMVYPVVRIRSARNPGFPFSAALVALLTCYSFSPLSLTTLPMMALYAGATWRFNVLWRQHEAPNLTRTAANSPPNVPRWLRIALGVGVVALALLLSAMSAQFLANDYRIRQADLLGSTEAALAAAEAMRPGTASHYWVAGRLAAFDARFRNLPEFVPIVDEALRQAQNLDPKDPMTQINWAIDLQVLQRHEEAIRRFQHALVIYPEWPLATKGIAFSYLKLGKPKEAIDLLEPIVIAYPHDTKASELLSQAISAVEGTISD